MTVWQKYGLKSNTPITTFLLNYGWLCIEVLIKSNANRYIITRRDQTTSTTYGSSCVFYLLENIDSISFIHKYFPASSSANIFRYCEWKTWASMALCVYLHCSPVSIFSSEVAHIRVGLGALALIPHSTHVYFMKSKIYSRVT